MCVWGGDDQKYNLHNRRFCKTWKWGRSFFLDIRPAKVIKKFDHNKALKVDMVDYLRGKVVMISGQSSCLMAGGEEEKKSS